MLKKFAVFLMLATVLIWAAPAAYSQDAKTVLRNASKAMGADNLKSIQYSGTATEFFLGQAYEVKMPWPSLADKSYSRTVDYEIPGWRVDRVVADIPADRLGGGFGGGIPPGPTQTVVIGPNTPWAQQVDLWMTPFGFLRVAAKSDATVESKSMGGKKYTVVTFTAPNKAKFSGYFDAQNMLDRVETWVANPMLGDMLVEATYTGYRDFGGVKFPTSIVLKQGGSPTLDFSVTDVKPNVAANIQGRAGGGAPQAPPTTSRKLADGVYLILPAYAALAVDFDDYIVVVEAPTSEERAEAIIAEAKKDIPNKPIKYLINTHNHFDHSSGLRTFIAEGATIVTYKDNKPYYEKIFALPHTLAPDRQETAKQKISIETVGEKKVLANKGHVIEIYHVQNTYHDAGLLMVYLPKEKILVEADLFNPLDKPPAAPPTVLIDNLKRLSLDVQTIVPIHYPPDGRAVTIADLMSAVAK
jgi:glyoxylase-like metal-dependent hydrolase (beta-lactamase superfamily II)